MPPVMPLADYLRSSKIDNFSIAGDRVRIGSRYWTARPCGCGRVECDGWELLPAPGGAVGGC
jgi:hypothetical protein